jgi:hypothetical protein
MAKPQVSRNEPQKAPYVKPTIRTIEVSEIEKRGLMGLLGRPEQRGSDEKSRAASARAFALEAGSQPHD